MNFRHQDRGLPIEQLAHIKPSMVLLSLVLLEMKKEGVTGEGVDLHYLQRAREDGRKVEGLEPVLKQIDLMVDMAKGHEDEFMAYSLKDLDDTQKEIAEIIPAWREGKRDQLWTLLCADLIRDYPDLYREMISDRNAAWLTSSSMFL